MSGSPLRLRLSLEPQPLSLLSEGAQGGSTGKPTSSPVTPRMALALPLVALLSLCLSMASLGLGILLWELQQGGGQPAEVQAAASGSGQQVTPFPGSLFPLP